MTKLKSAFDGKLQQLAKTVEAPQTVKSFLATAATSFGRATHYNTRAQQQAAEITVHERMLALSRDLYTVLLTIPGMTDRSALLGARMLLSNPNAGAELIDARTERTIVERMIERLPIQRVLKLMLTLRTRSEADGLGKANNARTRKLILRRLLGGDKLELWAVKYRRKMRDCLKHAWGVRMTGIVRSIASKQPEQRTADERRILDRQVAKYAGNCDEATLEAIAFALGGHREWTLPLMRAFVAAKSDLSAGAKLPLEVLDGLRATYHPNVPRPQLLETADHKSLSPGQRMSVQRVARERGLDVQMDYDNYDAVRLYVYAFEMGLDPRLEWALDRKAKKAAERFPFRYRRAGVLVDTSASMGNSPSQPLRPIATALAIRDIIAEASEETMVECSGGDTDQRLIEPAGDTSLARGLIRLLQQEPDAIFVISDGYENRPAGRFADVLQHVRRLGIATPIYHLNPVLAAEASGVRALAPDSMPSLPVARPESLAPAMLVGALDADPAAALTTLAKMARVPELTEEVRDAPTND